VTSRCWGLVLDCQDPAALAAFWGPAHGYVSVGAAGSYTLLLPDGRPGPKLLLQRVPEEKGGKNRMDLDIETADIEGAQPGSSASGQDGSVRRSRPSTAATGS
jgi:hypothetical protein